MWMPQQSPFQKDLKLTLDLSEEFKDRVGLMGFPLLMLSERSGIIVTSAPARPQSPPLYFTPNKATWKKALALIFRTLFLVCFSFD